MALRELSVASRWLTGIGLLAMLGLLTSRIHAQDVPPPLPADPNGMVGGNPNGAGQSDPNVEVMTRGPVHEAYAVPLSAGQVAGMTVLRQPPAAVEEVPPDMKPEGGKSVWIPGYWSWDDERRDFIWVSGVWRAPPPGYRWMPGYWQPAPDQGQQPGYRWVSGYWMPARLEEATFLPNPPQSIESGPTSESPGANYFWVGGHWQWLGTRYVWQPGYWSACQPDWIWVPSSYYWCPRGWVYVPGYWDYPLARRGLVFSPVYFAGPVAVYRPAVCLDAGAFSISLFCRPAYGHYYFGDYYDDHYVALGIRPWFYGSPRFGYDPLFTYYRWYHVDYMGERGWHEHLVGWHDYYRGHPDMRPPHTLAEQQRLLAGREGMGRPDLAQLRMAHDVHQVGGARLQQVSAAERAQIHQAARETARFGAERQQLEQRSAAGAVRGQPEKVSLASMPSYKSTQLPGASPANAAISRAGGTAAAAPGARGTPATAAAAARGRVPAKPAAKSNGREKEKKPQG